MKSDHSTLIVNLDAISRNVDVLQSYLTYGVKQMAVVKANAYGHGAVQVAQKISSRVDWFAVNDIEEGIELRENNIKNPVLVFGVPDPEFAAAYKRYNLTATVSAAAHFDILPEGSCYHLNFDTGMGRLGFRPEQAEEVRGHKINHPELKCTGIYSHLATADNIESEKSARQIELFQQLRRQFEPNLLTHLCNTAGAIQYPQSQFDMVRTGIGIYGYAPGKISIPGLEPVMHWQTRLVQVNPIQKGDTVSYGAAWQAKEDGYIGIIPVGYADGVPRGLSGHFKVTINGTRYPVAGTVTMNYCMVALGKKPLPVGTKVELWNKEHNAKIWAENLQTIPYEMLTGAAPGLNRTIIDKE